MFQNKTLIIFQQLQNKMLQIIKTVKTQLTKKSPYP